MNQAYVYVDGWADLTKSIAWLDGRNLNVNDGPEIHVNSY